MVRRAGGYPLVATAPQSFVHAVQQRIDALVELHGHGWIDMRLLAMRSMSARSSSRQFSFSASWRPISARPLPYSPPM